MASNDLRPQLAAAQDWVTTLVDGVRPDQLDAPTPCPELTVRALIRHLIGGTNRIRAVGEGGSALDVSAFPEVTDHVLATAYRTSVAAARQAWSDGVALDRPARVPWGNVTGAEAVRGYLMEALAHGWDLAVATGQDSEADPELAATGLEQARIALPSEGREHAPFGEVVPSATDAGPTERLANWTGRRSR